jgi:hypothetical protein
MQKPGAKGVFSLFRRVRQIDGIVETTRGFWKKNLNCYANLSDSVCLAGQDVTTSSVKK